MSLRLLYISVLAGEVLSVAEPYLERNMHPTVIIRAFLRARDDALDVLDKIALKVDVAKRGGLPL